MFLHQALPKNIQGQAKPYYEIRRRPSPLRKAQTSRNKQSSPERNKMQPQSPRSSRSHSITSKDKPSLASIEKKRLPQPKQISSSCLRKSNQRSQASPSSSSQQFSTPKVNNTPPKTANFPEVQPRIILCKIQNKVSVPFSAPFLYNDLSKIDKKYQLCYEGETKGNLIRHGYGTQWYVNGQKFVGIFEQDKAQGHGTYYGLRKKVMGLWLEDCLEQVFIEI